MIYTFLTVSCINPAGDARWRVMICKRSAFFFINLARFPVRDNSWSSFLLRIGGLVSWKKRGWNYFTSGDPCLVIVSVIYIFVILCFFFLANYLISRILRASTSHLLWHSTWHSSWHSIWHIFWHFTISGIPIFLKYVRAFRLTFLSHMLISFEFIWKILWHSTFIVADIPSATWSDGLSGILPGILSNIRYVVTFRLAFYLQFQPDIFSIF